MDYLEGRGLVLPGSRVGVLGNRLVLVASAGTRADAVDLRAGVDLAGAFAGLLAGGRLAMGDPAGVPAGRYAEAALRSLGVWDAVAPRLARAESVRAALLLVERGEAALGIVYATDVAASPGVRVVGVFGGETHPAIRYPFARTVRGGGEDARALMAFLTGREAAAVYRQHGSSCWSDGAVGGGVGGGPA